MAEIPTSNARKQFLVDNIWKLFVAFWLIFVLAPPLMLVVISFDTSTYIRIPQGFTLNKYIAMNESEKVVGAIASSLKYAVVTTVVTPIVALLAVLAYRKTKRKALFIALVVVPLFIPGTVHGLALLIFVQLLGIESSLISVSIAHILWAFPFSFLVLLTSASAVTDDILLASSDLGAHEFDTLRYTIYPLVKPGLISAVIFSFVLSFNEFSRSFYLLGNESTVPTFVWASLQVEFARELYAVAGSAVMITLVLIGIAVVYLFTRAQITVE